jgi:hypothetical protein
MSRFLERRHRRLMDESEQGLLQASESNSERNGRIAAQILADNKLHALWESRHAKLLVPVAEHRKTTHQIVDLRLASLYLIHGRAFIEHIRDHEIRGEERKQFFARYYGLMDYQNAVLAAHRHYMISVSSMVSTSHLIDLMFDPVSNTLLRRYKAVYGQYFELCTYAAGSEDANCAKALAPIIASTKKQLNDLRHRLETDAPDARCSEIERQTCLAQSGRYPILNYMVT